MGIRVLLVDDEEEFVSTLSERLQLRGFDATFATSGIEALGLIKSMSPEVVVLDVIMPGLCGFDVLKKIKTDRPDLPVILLTGHSSTQDGIKGMNLGAFDYVMKPVDIEELVNKIEEAKRGKK